MAVGFGVCVSLTAHMNLAQITGKELGPGKFALRHGQGLGATMTSEDDEADEQSHRDDRCQH